MKRKKSVLLIFMLLAGLLAGCSKKNIIDTTQKQYDGRVFYEIFVRAFNDSNDDGIGDLNGVTQKLDYLKDLGVKGIWLMPINESTSYHGYDISDYYKINPEYGTMEDYKKLLDEAHKRDIKVYMDMVINHTSTEHPWFKEARSNPNSKYRNYYIFTEDEQLSKILSPMGTMPWTKNGDKNEYYYSIFSQSMPDLNFDNKEVREEVKKIAKYYIDMGVDGFRLDAVKWIYNDTDKNLQFLAEYSEYCKSLRKDFGLVGEVWDNLFGIIPYQTALDSVFDFPLGDNIVKGINSGNIERIPGEIKDNYQALTERNSSFIPAPFLTNHDQDRVMNKFITSGNIQDVDKMKMAAAIYLSLPGTPFMYYGEEIGMKGTKPDEMIREPFIWSNEDNKYNTSWTKITNDMDKVALNVQEKDSNSIYNFYKGILKVRNEHKAMRLGNIEPVDTGDSGILHMERTFDKERIVVLINCKDEDGICELNKGKYDVLFSNTERADTVKGSKEFKLKSGEILILNKK